MLSFSFLIVLCLLFYLNSQLCIREVDLNEIELNLKNICECSLIYVIVSVWKLLLECPVLQMLLVLLWDS